VSYVLTSGFSGMGDMQSASQAVGYGSAAAGTAVGALTAAGLIPMSAVPFIGPVLAGVTLAVTALIKNSGCGQTCIQTSAWANQAADQLQKNLDAYMAIPTPRPASAQQLALQNFDSVWAQLVKMCGDPQWGDAGKRCISDRQQGACKWKNNGQCWNWFTGYRDPIANDPNVTADSAVPSNVLSAIQSGSGSSLLPLAIVVGLIALGVSL
jgi:hypothetical protein